MDWSRAKSIMIAILLVCDLILGGMWLKERVDENREIAAANTAAVSYAENHGVSINCDIPSNSKRVYVLSLTFSEGEGNVKSEYRNVPIEVLGSGTEEYLSGIKKKGSKIEVLPAYSAVLKSVSNKTFSIDSIELIYLVDRSAYGGQGGQDTALPYWKLRAGNNYYYYAAYSD